MKVTIEIEDKANKEERQNALDAQATIQGDIDTLEMKLAAIKADASAVNKKITPLRKEVSRLARIGRGVKIVKMECDQLDDREGGKKIYFKWGTKEVVKEEPYDFATKEPLFDKKAAKAAPKADAKADKQSDPPLGKPAKKSSKTNETHVGVLDVDGNAQSVPKHIADSLRSANARTEPFTYTIDKKRVELAFVIGEPVFGVGESGKTYEVTPFQVKSIREGKAGGGGCSLHGIDEDIVGLALMPGKEHVALPKAKKGSKRGAKKGSKKSGKAAG